MEQDIVFWDYQVHKLPTKACSKIKMPAESASGDYSATPLSFMQHCFPSSIVPTWVPKSVLISKDYNITIKGSLLAQTLSSTLFNVKQWFDPQFSAAICSQTQLTPTITHYSLSQGEGSRVEQRVAAIILFAPQAMQQNWCCRGQSNPAARRCKGNPSLALGYAELS